MSLLSVYKCPHCGKVAFNPITKAFAGRMNSRGKPCKYCGRRCCNGMASTVFHTIMSFALLVFAAVCYVGDFDFGAKAKLFGNEVRGSFIVIFLAIVAYFVVCILFDAFFGKMTVPARTDAY